MNPLTQVKLIQSRNAKESDLGISNEASWHAEYKNSAYVYAGLLPFDLTEGDILAVFSQYGEIVDVNLVRDKATGKSRGFAFIAYEDQRSTILAVENLNAAQLLGRTIKVNHCGKYTKREEEDEETQRQNREARGVCRAFQRGECTRGDSCKFSHDEKRAANTGWGHEEDRSSKWDHDKFNGAKKGGGTSFGQRGDFKPDEEEKGYREKGHGGDASYGRPKERERVEREDREPRYDRREQKRSGRHDDSQSRRHDADVDYVREDKRSRTDDREKLKAESRRDHYDREEKGSSRRSDTSTRQDRDSSRWEDRRR
ncbi:PREDICTED: zinc finger CCCH domain-containing protein 42 [Camelina sativa]|uniref:Zinc finger CCCH domain-containing protein 42 n=1 Tax=Camelina sativa TaxID=90675 RepID=A0ABM0YMQ4_CAMSA|nr:PREDICTED: zinc finger CCCH domain-containing protein 42 [Camelina sativa]